MPARSQHLGWSCEQQGRPLPGKSNGVQVIRGTGEDRELLVLGMGACVIGLLYTCASLVCHKIMTEQMPGSSPRGLVQVLSMVLLSALSSEYFLTWLLNMLWAGTWHRAALAPKVLVLFQTKCHGAWLRSASEEGEAKHSGGGTLHPSYDTALQISSPSERSKWWAGRAELHLRKSGDRWFLRGCWLRWRVPHALPYAGCEAAAPGGTCTASGSGLAASKDLCGLPGKGRASLGFTSSDLGSSPAATCTVHLFLPVLAAADDC